MEEIGTYEYYTGLKNVIKQDRLTWWVRLQIYLTKNVLYFPARYIMRIRCISTKCTKIYLTFVQNIRFILFVVNILEPCCRVLGKIIRARNIGNWIDKYAEKYETGDNGIAHNITVSEIYDILQAYPQEHGLRLLQQLPIPPLAYELLIDSFINNSKDIFISTIYKYNCDISKLKNFCLNNNPLSKRFLKKSKEYSSLEKLILEYLLDFSVLQHRLHIASFTEHTRKLYVDTQVQSEGSYFGKFNLKLIRKELHSLFIFYFIHKEEFNLIEQNIVEEIIKQPKYFYFYKRAYECYKKYYKQDPKYLPIENIKIGETDSKGLKLPDNYFELQWNVDDCISTDDIRDTIKLQGVRKFESFVDYIAAEGYITEDIQTKESFAYRLTGRCKPKELVEKIEWGWDASRGKNENRHRNKKEDDHCLYYIVRHFYFGNGRKGINNSDLPTSRYERIKIFFIIHGTVSNPTSYAAKAEQDFKNKVSEFFTKEIEKAPPKTSF